jgi:hypothetical protein
MPDDAVNLNIVEGEPFFAHEVTVNFTPTQLTFDFKCITPRTDPRSRKPSFQLKHNVIMMEPWHASALMNVLAGVLKKYEQEYGKLEKPKALAKAERKRALAMKRKAPGARAAAEAVEAPTYLG